MFKINYGPRSISFEDLYTAIKRTDYKQAIAHFSQFPACEESPVIRINTSYYSDNSGRSQHNQSVFLLFDLTTSDMIGILNKDPYVRFSFSNSARDRIGVFVKVNTYAFYHEPMATQIRNYMKVTYGFDAHNLPTLNKTVPISYDPNAYFNENSKVMPYDSAFHYERKKLEKNRI